MWAGKRHEPCRNAKILSAIKLIEEDRKLPEKTVKKFAYELVEGLSYLHENSIIYADLKPTNILINEFSNLKLGDFGLSKKIQDLM